MKQSELFDPFAMMQRTFPTSAAFSAATRQGAANFWAAQERLLDGMEDFATEWFERRRIGTRSALASARDMCEAETPFDALREYQKWATGSLERVMQDGAACQKQLVEFGRLGLEPPAQTDESARSEPASEHAPRQHSRVRAA